MAITDKTRKVLWGRSGNLCAFCKAHLVLDASQEDRESVVGDECHIVSGAPGGPRHDPNFPAAEIDSLDNLLLLCRVHHKLIDDQADTFSAVSLRELKGNHEKWVKERLTPTREPESIKIVRAREEIPEVLVMVPNAKTMLDFAAGCDGRYDDYPVDLTEYELSSVGSFLQNLTDWCDLGISEPSERIQAQRSIAEEMAELERLDLTVYAAQEKQQVRGGVGGPRSFHVLHVRIVRKNDPNQIPLISVPADSQPSGGI